MKKTYIYGLGKGKQVLDICLKKDDVDIIAYIDQYKAKNEELYEGLPVIRAEEIVSGYDAIIITLMQYTDVRKNLCNLGVPKEKIICFYSFNDAEIPDNWSYIDVFKWHTELMWKNYTEVLVPCVKNYPYELYAEELAAKQEIPIIVSANKTAEIIRREKKCLARFGDGEFELILGRNRAHFQTVNDKLSIRLKNVLASDLDNLLIAIADNYGSLGKYTESVADAIRQYVGTGNVREEHMKLLDLSRMYYDAYLSRPYMIYRDKENAGTRFENVKKIWEDQNVVIVEGEHTRFGVGNDLLNNAKSVRRILTLDKDCFSLYDDLLWQVKQYSQNKLVLIILGPTAAVMAYDLALENYWAVDIGQLDVEYEWYLRQVTERCDIPYKTVSEVPKYDSIEMDEKADYIKRYQGEIIKTVMK